jgi:hypothetical protein
MGDIIALHGGGILETHDAQQCGNDGPVLGPPCCIHNPSQHALTDRPLHWRGDRGLMERICEHGIGHPDPDGLAHRIRTQGEIAWAAGIHTCDGCCRATP